MKKKLATIINLFLLCILFILNVVFIDKLGVNNDSILMLAFAIIFILLYILGILFPNATVRFIHSISCKLYKNSTYIRVPVLVEAKRTFLKRLIYILICCNTCLFLSLLTFIFKI